MGAHLTLIDSDYDDMGELLDNSAFHHGTTQAPGQDLEMLKEAVQWKLEEVLPAATTRQSQPA